MEKNLNEFFFNNYYHPDSYYAGYQPTKFDRFRYRTKLALGDIPGPLKAAGIIGGGIAAFKNRHQIGALYDQGKDVLAKGRDTAMGVLGTDKYMKHNRKEDEDAHNTNNVVNQEVPHVSSTPAPTITQSPVTSYNPVAPEQPVLAKASHVSGLSKNHHIDMKKQESEEKEELEDKIDSKLDNEDNDGDDGADELDAEYFSLNKFFGIKKQHRLFSNSKLIDEKKELIKKLGSFYF